MNMNSGSLSRWPRALVAIAIATITIPMTSTVVHAEDEESAPTITCKDVLENWGLISVDNDGVITENVNINGTYTVATIDQLYCIGAGAYLIQDDEFTSDGVSICSDSPLGELLHATYTQANNLDFDDLTVDGAEYWRPIGNNGCQFVGVYDGNGKTISDLYFDEPDLATDQRAFEGIGLFGSAGFNGRELETTTRTFALIKNVILENVYFVGFQDVGGIVGIADANTVIRNVHVTGTVGASANGWGDVGGVVGWANGGDDQLVTIEDVTVEIEITAVAGDDEDYLVYCAGGIVGYADYVVITNANATTHADDNLIHSVGGVGGCFGTSEIRDSFAIATLTANETVAGILGWAGTDVTIERSASHVTLSGGNKVGGLVGGYFQLTATDTYAIGTISGNARVGGLVGGSESENADINVDTSYASVAITADDESASGGLIGAIREDSTATITQSFWDTTVSGYNHTAEDLGDGKITAELQRLATFSDAGWDIATAIDNTKTWGLCTNINIGLPFIQNLVAVNSECVAPTADDDANPGDNQNNSPNNEGATNPNSSGSSPAPALSQQVRNRKLMESLTPTSFTQITPSELSQLPKSAIRGITKEHAAVMTREQFLALKPEQIRVLRPTTLAALPSGWLAQLSSGQVKWLLPRQIKMLSEKQLEKFSAKQRELIASVMRKAAKQTLR
jgi:hypothetical protein